MCRDLLNILYPIREDRSKIRLVDLACLEGGCSVEFTRMGFDVLGIEFRESNFIACKITQDN